MPKSSVGPDGVNLGPPTRRRTLTTRVMGRCQQNSTGSPPLANDVRSCGGAQNTVLAHQQLLDAVCRTNFCNELYDLGVVVSPVSSNDEEGVLGTLGDGLKQGGDEVLGIVLLLEDYDLFTQAGTGKGQLSSAMIAALSRITHVPGFWPSFDAG